MLDVLPARLPSRAAHGIHGPILKPNFFFYEPSSRWVSYRLPLTATPLGFRLSCMHSQNDCWLFLLGVNGQDGMRVRLEELRTIASTTPDRLSLAELARRLQGELPSNADCRCAIVASRHQELAAGVEVADRLLWSSRLAIKGGAFVGVGGPFRIGLLFPGQGAPVLTSAGALGQCVPRAAAVFGAAGLPPSPREVSANLVQLAVVVSSLAALTALRERGVQADFALGHSLGELTALHWAGALDADALTRLVRARGEAMTAHAAARGGMATVCADERTLAHVMDGIDVTLACLNSPTRHVVSGEPQAITAVLARARELGVRAVNLNVVGAFHSPLMRPAVPFFERHLDQEHFEPLCKRVLSSVTGAVLDTHADLARLLARQIIDPVRFLEAARLAASEADLLLEVGPGHALAGLMSEIASTPTISMRIGESSPRGTLEASAAVFAAGVMPTSGQPPVRTIEPMRALTSTQSGEVVVG